MTHEHHHDLHAQAEVTKWREETHGALHIARNETESGEGKRPKKGKGI